MPNPKSEPKPSEYRMSGDGDVTIEPRIPGTEPQDREAVETDEAKAKRMKKARKDYDLHVAMVASTEDVETAEAKFLVWYEGREGLRRRLGLPPEV